MLQGLRFKAFRVWGLEFRALRVYVGLRVQELGFWALRFRPGQDHRSRYSYRPQKHP